MEEQAYTLRELQADDLYGMIRIVNKIGLEEVQQCFGRETIRKAVRESGEEAEPAEAVGLQVVTEIAKLALKKLPECREEIYAFLSGLSGMKPQQIAALPLGTFGKMVMDVFRMEGLADFFTELFRSRA